MKRQTLFLLISLIASCAFADDEADRAAAKFFENEVRPVLASRCYECHGEKKQKGGLRVDDIGYLQSGGDTGPALVPGKPEESPIIEAVRYLKSDFQMPPKEKLPDAEVAVLEKWVRMGAPWPKTPRDSVVLTEGGFTKEQRGFWFFQPLGDHQPPNVSNPWVRTDIDRFISQKHSELGLSPAPSASAYEFVRRATMDLHGLPPTAEQVRDFASDKRPDALERFIDGLLESPRYGERWAQHWLDLVRYSESDGYNADGFRPFVWPYRDWVIKSLNADKPYDQFVREQLAGDETDPDNPEVLIATSYLRMPIYEWNQTDVRNQWDIILTDVTDTTGELFLGLSFGCARCHNHKFDPILQKDYFRLRSFFAPLQWRDDLSLASTAQKDDYNKRQAAWEECTQGIRAEMSKLVDPLIASSVKSAKKRFNDEYQEMFDKPSDELSPLEKQLANIGRRQLDRARKLFDPLKSIKTAEAREKYVALSAELKKFDHLKPAALMEAFVATDVGPVAPPTTFKTRRGEQEVAPGFLTLLDPSEANIVSSGSSTGRRTALANWITRPDNQLSTRVIVNRVWQYHFGRGLVGSSSDFGKLGETPSHPELLDWLARKFVAEGWSLKRLHKEIMLSSVYAQTAHVKPSPEALRLDPGNRFLWRFSPRRLDAEQVRDAMLAASGELDLKEGGVSAEANGARRSIYTIKKRNNQNELLKSLDAPAGFSSTAERQSTTTPTQALLLMNGDWTLDRARKFAGRVKSVEEAWQVAFGRSPTAPERETAEAFLSKRLGGSDKLEVVDLPKASNPALFKEKTAHERLVDQTQAWEGDDFSVEAIVRLDSIDTAAAVRTIASRWVGSKDSLESFGWSLGVTGEKSRFKPHNLVVQLVGEDENSNISYEVVASNLKIELGKRYQVSVYVSCAEHAVTFRLKNLDDDLPPVEKVVPHQIRGKLGYGAASLVVGGLFKRSVSHHWDGLIEAFQILSGNSFEKGNQGSPSLRKNSIVKWVADGEPNMSWAWSGEAGKGVDSVGPRTQAMSDLCQVLLNCSEFIYLH